MFTGIIEEIGHVNNVKKEVDKAVSESAAAIENNTAEYAYTEEVKKEEKTENKEKELNEQISKLKDELADVKDRHTRLIAEFDNLKKRSAKEREGLYNSIIGDIISSLLPVIDNLEKATEAETKDEEYKKGIELVLKQFKDVLTANGVCLLYTSDAADE